MLPLRRDATEDFCNYSRLYLGGGLVSSCTMASQRVRAISRLNLNLKHPWQIDADKDYYYFGAFLGYKKVIIMRSRSDSVSEDLEKMFRLSRILSGMVNSQQIGEIIDSVVDENENRCLIMQHYKYSFAEYAARIDLIQNGDISKPFAKIFIDFCQGLLALFFNSTKHAALESQCFVVTRDLEGVIVRIMPDESTISRDPDHSIIDDFNVLRNTIVSIFDRRQLPYSFSKLLNFISVSPSGIKVLQNIHKHPMFMDADKRLSLTIEVMTHYQSLTSKSAFKRSLRNCLRVFGLNPDTYPWQDEVKKDPCLHQIYNHEKANYGSGAVSFFTFARNVAVHYKGVFMNLTEASFHVEFVWPNFIDALFHAFVDSIK